MVANKRKAPVEVSVAEALVNAFGSASVSGARCYIYVEGTEMYCPLCGTLVTSGSEHDCTKDGGIRTVRTRPKEKK